MTEMVGTAPYMSPNMIEGRYGPETDLWSLGVMMYFILTREELFPGQFHDEVVEKVKSFQTVDSSNMAWSRLSDGAKDLVQGLLQIDEKLRLTARDVLCKLPPLHHCLEFFCLKLNVPFSA